MANTRKHNAQALMCGYHTKLITLVNRGLITPNMLLNSILDNVRGRIDKFISVEFIINVLLGDREYAYMVYEWKGERLRNMGRGRSMPMKFYLHNTGVKLIDHILDMAQNYPTRGGLQACLCLFNMSLIKPEDIYNWFMCFTDVGDCLTVPYVYNCNKYDSFEIIEKLMLTTPYYIHLRNDIDICANIWNAIYYNYIGERRRTLRRQNARGSKLVAQWTLLSPESKSAVSKIYGEFMHQCS